MEEELEEQEVELEALTPAERQQRRRAKLKGLPDPFADRAERAKERAQREQRTNEHTENLAWAYEQDAKETYYKSEYRPCVQLLALYEGADIADLDEGEPDDEEGEEPKKKKSKTPVNAVGRPNPSRQRLTIRAIVTPDGRLIEPPDYRKPEFKNIYEVDEIVSFQTWLELRDKARKDLLWLGRLLGKQLFHSVHQYVCDQFVKKNFDGLFFPGFNIDDFHEAIAAQVRYANDGVTRCHEMVLLEQRGGYKSTIDGIDAAQWLINCPDIRIMIITAVKGLAEKFAKEIKKYFFFKKRVSAFHLLFPEFILTGIDGSSSSPIECPASLFNQKESNLWVTSIGSSNTGDHCDVRKADDVVNSKNSVDTEMRQALKDEFDGTDDILDQWGFSDVIGTRYFTDDWYGTRQLPDKETGELAPFRYSCRGAFTLDPAQELLYKMGHLTVLEIIDKRLGTLVFPYKLGWEKLRRILNKKGLRSFKNQQMNEATDANADDAFINPFDEAIIKAHTRPVQFYDDIVADRSIQTWDVAYSEKRTSDFSVGAQHKIYRNERGEWAACTRHIIFNKWKGSDLVEQIVHFYERYKPEKVYIENSNGVGFLVDNILTYAIRKGSNITSCLEVIELDTKAGAKSGRIKDLEILMSKGCYDIVDGEWMPGTIDQLVKYNGKKSTQYRKDDIPDNLAFLLRHMPRSAFDKEPDHEKIGLEEVQYRRQKEQAAWYRATFGDRLGTANERQPQKNEEPAAPAKPRDPRLRILGGGLGWRM